MRVWLTSPLPAVAPVDPPQEHWKEQAIATEQSVLGTRYSRDDPLVVSGGSG